MQEGVFEISLEILLKAVFYWIYKLCNGVENNPQDWRFLIQYAAKRETSFLHDHMFGSQVIAVIYAMEGPYAVFDDYRRRVFCDLGNVASKQSGDHSRTNPSKYSML